MSSWIRPLRSVARKLLRSPSFALLSILTLGLGIGANSAIFSVVNGVLLEPLPYAQPDRLVGVWHTAPGIELPQFEQSDATYLLYRQSNRVFDDFAIYDQGRINLTGGERPVQLPAAEVTASLFPVLGVTPALGRAFTEADERPGAEPVAVISHELWTSRLGGDRAALGETLRIDGVARTVVGVMPAGFGFPSPETMVWQPMEIDPEEPNVGNFSYPGVARLLPGKTPEDARIELSALVHRLPEVFPDDDITPGMLENAGVAALVHPLRDDVIGDVGGVLWVLLGSVGFILLIACANVANLFLVRAEGRQREMAIRAALGARRADLAGAFLAESTVLGLAGGALGLGLAAAGVRAFVAVGPDTVPRLEEIGIDGGVLAFTALISLFAGALFGVMPALRADPSASVLGEGGRRSTAGRARHRAQGALVVGQIALALVLLVGSGLMVRSFQALRDVDPGFDAASVLTLRLSLPGAQYPEAEDRAGFYEQALERIRALPGVEAAGAVTQLPLAEGGSNSTHTFEDFPLEPDEVPRIIATRRAAPGYFEALGVPLLAGRVLEPADHQRQARVAVISEAVAEHFWDDASAALGRRLSSGTAARHDWYTIVGVVGSVRDEGLTEEPAETVYYPMVTPPAPDEDEGALAPYTMSLAVRASVPPESLAGAVRQTIWDADPNLPVANVRTMAEILAGDRARAGFTMLLLSIAAAVALLLGTVGLYGVISYVVSQRTQEIGVRMALGAGRGQVSRMVVRQGLGVALAGIVAGLAVAAAATRLLEASLFGVESTDPLTFAAVSLLLVAVAVVASYLPARRAASVDPLAALHHD